MTAPPVPPASGEPRASAWEDFVDILYAPSQVYARRENGNFWIPLLVVSALLGVLWIAGMRVLEPVFDAEFDRHMARMLERDPRMTAEQLAAGREMAARFQMVAAFLITPAAIAVLGFTVWLVGKLFDAQQTIRSALVVAGFAYVPRVIEQIVAIGEGLLRDPATLDGRNRLVWGVARFLDPDVTQPTLIAILSRLDVFTIWVTVLIAIGLAVTGRVSRQRAAVAGVLLWLIGGIPTFFAGLWQ